MTAALNMQHPLMCALLSFVSSTSAVSCVNPYSINHYKYLHSVARTYVMAATASLMTYICMAYVCILLYDICMS